MMIMDAIDAIRNEESYLNPGMNMNNKIQQVVPQQINMQQQVPQQMGNQLNNIMSVLGKGNINNNPVPFQQPGLPQTNSECTYI